MENLEITPILNNKVSKKHIVFDDISVQTTNSQLRKKTRR